MKIAICDDNMQEILHIVHYLKKYIEEKQADITYKIFQSASKVIDTINTDKYDILILDILMPGITGIEVAKEIRGYGNDIKIIFITSSPEFAVESYTVDAYQYLVKPVNEEKLFPVLDKLVAASHKPAESINIKTQSGIIRIPFFGIEYVEVFSKTVSFHTTYGKPQEVYGSLKDFENDLLKRAEFIKVHRSYIVNMRWIQELGTKEIITELKYKVPISRPLYAFVRKTYMEYLFIEKDIKE